jgi:amino acid permease
MDEKKIANPDLSEDASISINNVSHIEGTPVERETVKRKLKSRHMQFYAIGGTIGTGLFVGIGGGLATAGPLSLLLGYSITSIFIFAMVSCALDLTSHSLIWDTGEWFGWVKSASTNRWHRCDVLER